MIGSCGLDFFGAGTSRTGWREQIQLLYENSYSCAARLRSHDQEDIPRSKSYHERLSNHTFSISTTRDIVC